MVLNPYAIFVLLCGALLVALALYALNHRSTKGALVFVWLNLTGAIYTLGYGMELASLDLQTMLFWNRIEYLGTVFFPVLFLVFVLEFASLEKWVSRRNITLLFIIPLITLTLKLTGDTYHLIYSSIAIDPSGPIPLLAFTRGTWYWVIACYNLITVLVSILLLWNRRMHSSPVYQRQATIIVLSTLIPYLAYIIYVIGIEPFQTLKHLDLNPFVYTIWGAGISWGMFRYRLFELRPIAREALIEILRDGVVVLDTQNRVIDANPASRQIFGWSKPPVGHGVEKAFQGWPDLLALCLAGGSATAEIRHDSGELTEFYDVNISVLKEKGGLEVGRLLVAHEITRRKIVEKELQQSRDKAEASNVELKEAWLEMEKVATTDKLTGVFNRRKFEEIIVNEINKATRYSVPLSLVMIDIDNFKLVNDQFGHHMGDEVLIELAQVISSNTRGSDMVIRWGGEEFILLTPGINLEQAVQLADKVRDLVDGHLFPSSVNIAISLGVAQYHYSDTPDSLVRRADHALYLAKKNGRNRVEGAKIE